MSIFNEFRRSIAFVQGFGSFEGAMPAFFFAHLLQTNKINEKMHSYQTLRIALVGLSMLFNSN
jgi:hypothetical protein